MISIIIPTFNESGYLKATIRALLKNDKHRFIKEIIVADGGSKDSTISEAKADRVKLIKCPVKGRAAQMNYGAAFATGEILYFLHADTIPPVNFTAQIINTIKDDNDAGCYRLAFDYPHWFLKLNCWFTRFDVNTFRFGDQSLFVKKTKFLKAGGFCEKHLVLEDQHLIRRLKDNCRFTIINQPVLTSARKYLTNGIYKTQGIFFLIYFLYRLGLSQKQLVSTYHALIRQE